MKKLVALLAVFSLVFLALAGCGASEERETVTLTYANWNLGTEEENNIQRQLIAAYVEANPNVTIEVVDMSGEGSWDQKLTALAAAGNLPDVFMIDKMPYYVQQGWLADLASYTKSDKDWAKVSDALKSGFSYDGKVYGLPSAQFLMGYFVNKDLYDAANLDAPEYGISAEDFFAVAAELNDVANGVLGLDEQEFVLGWYANTQNPDLRWFSFDGTHMNYNSTEFKEAVAKTVEIKSLTWQGLTDEQKAVFAVPGPWELFLNNKVGVRWDATWSLQNYLDNASFDWDFIGVPGGNQALVADALAVSNTADSVKEAYLFAKYMSFSTAGYAKEVELSKAADKTPKMPVAIDEASLDLYKEFIDSKPGVLAALNNLDNSMIESLAKIIPGYVQARWEGKPGITLGEEDANMWKMFFEAGNGSYDYSTYSSRLESFANALLKNAKAELSQE